MSLVSQGLKFQLISLHNQTWQVWQIHRMTPKWPWTPLCQIKVSHICVTRVPNSNLFCSMGNRALRVIVLEIQSIMKHRVHQNYFENYDVQRLQAILRPASAPTDTKMTLQDDTTRSNYLIYVLLAPRPEYPGITNYNPLRSRASGPRVACHFETNAPKWPQIYLKRYMTNVLHICSSTFESQI